MSRAVTTSVNVDNGDRDSDGDVQFLSFAILQRRLKRLCRGLRKVNRSGMHTRMPHDEYSPGPQSKLLIMLRI